MYMKNAIISAISKLTLGIALSTVALTGHAQTALYPSEKNADIRYLGVSDGNMMFNVAYDNPSGNKFSITVVAQDGSPMFQEVYTDRKFDKRFVLPMTDKEKVTFVIRNFRDADLKQSFEIDTRVIEDVVVTKVK
jgi:hypothetical protein